VTDEQDPDRGIPPSVSLRWPILVVLDEMGEEDAILEFQERVAHHLNLPDDAGDVVDPDTGRSLLTERSCRRSPTSIKRAPSTAEAMATVSGSPTRGVD
jgi:hypothetical protein